ncbi:hypothetical protein [Mucilaginibacter sp. UR6-11]|uniref:hypothetical protein n=1 Tax=Mucilaginibacter sp. UR6-11 TaxID=1435644 RepID=UPI001E32A8D7|nr:hypothetical protein [Mucilaginibacter sp. UR6-11]MCC8426846.1 hypothetical protein [Mucilaginibacter sp. UR6-11]
MKYITIACLAALIIASCSSPKSNTAGADSVINEETVAKNTPINNNNPAVYSLCFLNREGKDSTSIELVVSGDKVTGTMNWLPYQKDSRKGTLNGIIKNDELLATWNFMQEGMKDTLKLNFLLKDGELSQKPLKQNAKTGRQQTDESADYSIKYESSTRLHK